MREYEIEHRLTGGLRLAANKSTSTAQAIDPGFVPRQLILAMRQHRGSPARPIVRVGDRVLKGQLIGEPDGAPSAAVHASTSGRVRAIEEREIPGGSRLRSSICVVIDTDGEDEPVPAGSAPWPETRAERLALLRRAGLAGLGGAAFPTADKLGSDGDAGLLIVNGAECEPYISCDDMLMREAAADVLDGVLLMADLLGCRLAIVAIERDKPEALRAIRTAAEAADDSRLRIAEVPTIYPAGGERQLIELLTGTEVPSGQYPTDIGLICQNVGTACAVARLARHGQPLLARVVTVTGRGVARPMNVETLIGTPIDALIEHCGGYRDGIARLLVGGSMMGYALPSDRYPVTKATNCLIAATAAELKPADTEWPCIRCGECARVCPARLQPQELLIAALASDHDALAGLGLDDCIECGCCDVICPSRIPLTERFRHAKLADAHHREQQQFSQLSEQRARRRGERLEQQRRHEQRLQQELKREVTAGAAEREAAIRAAVARARHRR